MPSKDKYSPTVTDRLFAEQALNAGCPYQAQYILMFGVEMLDPGRLREGIVQRHEPVYKKWVEEGHPYDWYFDIPDDVLL